MRGEAASERVWPGRVWLGGLGAIQLAGLLLAFLVAPALVNGDGLGYLKASVEPGPIMGPYPGHLGYLPLLRAVARLFGSGEFPADRLGVARGISLVGGVLTSTVLGLWARRAYGARAGWLSAAGIWASAGALAAFADVETYGIALGAVTLALSCAESPRWRGSLVAAVAAAAAVLLHIENVLLFIPLWLRLPARRRLPVIGLSGILVAAAYGSVVWEHGFGWLVGAGHGYVQTQRWLIPVKAVYGAGKALVYAPYLYESGWPTVASSSALGILALGILVFCWQRPWPKLATAGWLVPYVLVGAAFFGSDAERWLFLLPLLWLGVAAGSRRRLAAIMVLLLVAADLALVWPVARDHRALDRAVAAAALVEDGDLILSPGHGWDEYLGFVARRHTHALPLVYHAALKGRARLASTVAAEVAATRAAHHRVLFVRMTGDGDPRGWKELAPLGIDRTNIDTFLPSGTRVRLGPDVEELR